MTITSVVSPGLLMAGVLALTASVGPSEPRVVRGPLDLDVGAPEAPTMIVETQRGERLEGQLVAAGPDGLELQVQGGTHRIDAEDLLLAWAAGRPRDASDQAQTPADLLFMTAEDGSSGGGDRLWGRLEGGTDFELLLRLEFDLTVEVPFDHVDRLLPAVDRPVDRLVALGGDGIDDRLWRRRPDGGLDGVTGVLARVADRNLVMESALGELSFPADDVLALVLAATEHPARALDGLPVRVRLTGGSLFEAGLQEVREETLVFQTQFADEFAVPREQVVSMLFHSPGVRQLADERPVEVEEWTAIGGPDAVLFPWRPGCSVSGLPLSVGNVLRTTGLGVHANARLTYVVPEGIGALRVTAGLADEVLELPAEATVSFEILLDGEQVATTGLLREGDDPVDLRVESLKPGQRLQLVTLDGGDLDAGDRAAWVDGVFLPAR